MLRKWIRRIIIIFFSLVVIILVAGYILLIAHQKEIHALITDTFTEKLSGRLQMKDMDFTIFDRFPNFTICLDDVYLTDSASAVRGDTLLTAGKISIGVDLPRLFVGTIQFNTIKISDASIYIVKDSSGRMNTPRARVANVQTKEKKKITIPNMKKITLKNVSFHFTDSLKGKKFGLTFKKAEFKSIPGDAPMNYRLNTDVHFDGLVFNPVKGGYLTDQDIHLITALSFDPDSLLLNVKNGKLELKKQNLTVNIQMNFAKKTMKMRFDAKSVLPAVAFGALTPAIQQKLKNYQLEKPVTAQVIINGFITPGSKPAVDVYFKTTGNKLSMGVRSFENLHLLGWFTTHLDSSKIYDDHNSMMVFPVFEGTYFGMPIHSEVKVTDLKDPLLVMKAHLEYDHTKQGEVTTPLLKFLNGAIDIQYVFNGPLVHFVDTINKVTIGDLSGSAVLQHLDVNHLSTGYEFRDMTGTIAFRKPNLRIDSLSLKVNGNRLRLNGEASYFIAFLFIPGVKAQASLNLVADTIDFNSFHTPPSAQKEKTASEKKDDADIASLINWIASSVEFNINLSAQKVKMKNFSATDIKANIMLDHDSLRIKDAGMKTSGGTFLLNLAVSNISAKQHKLSFKTSIKNVRMNDLLYSFDNFGQSAVTNNNIFGTLSTSASFTSNIDQNYNVISSSMNGSLRTRVKNGSLKNMEGFEKISNYVFKNRDFSNIKFADISNHAKLTGTVLDIDTLDVFTSVITLFISGTFDFNKQNTDLLVTVPFSNLKKMEASERMALSDSVARKGGNLTLRATHNDQGELKISPVIFGKKKKKNSKGKET